MLCRCSIGHRDYITARFSLNTGPISEIVAISYTKTWENKVEVDRYKSYPLTVSQKGVLELHIHTDPWDPFLSCANRSPDVLNYHRKIMKNMFWILEHLKPSETKIFLVKIRSGLTPHSTEMGEVKKAFQDVRESRTARRWLFLLVK